ncbi:hypothetical protein SEA_AVOCADO_41 [Mycobacterium phage Avocado]|uniref:Uncharacterized protein n=1 Tax=Mycobacterium phage Avocado TaxID=2024302 RepID=A0A222YY74_9CAUD|nr:hypothetical protein KDW73_gp41 [Mycobacterium phage Avocado]ASR77242.1 hypothetical protein SEA_AVOCADO_41 [Mycobacterium phage Avocado]
MKIGMDDETAQRVDDLTAALDASANAQTRLAGAIEAQTKLLARSAQFGGGR